jgi:predicted NAD/FAD-dependent oxidoreductase
MKKKAVIIGAGPAGLTAGLELLRRSEIVPVILEASDEIGGISRTIRYKGNRMDIGGHRFFSKSDRVMQWWMDLMPPELSASAAAAPASAANGQRAEPVEISYQGRRRVVLCPRTCTRSLRCAGWGLCKSKTVRIYRMRRTIPRPRRETRWRRLRSPTPAIPIW